MTNLVVPGYVDDPELVKRMCGWILANLGPDHPLHFLRFDTRGLDVSADAPAGGSAREAGFLR